MSDEYERNILQTIDEHGWFCTSVFDPNGARPTFSYSVGFTRTLNAPEFIVFGLDSKMMHSMLWQAFRDIKAGHKPRDLEAWGGLLAGHDCVIRAVHPTNIIPEYLNSAIWLWSEAAAREPLAVFQIVWPGAGTKLFPWDEGCPQVVRDEQPPLYLPNASLH